MSPTLFNERTYQPQTLRDYQRNAVDALKQAWAEGEAAPLAALATGAGKTTIISQLLVEACDPNQYRSLVVAHTEEIVVQLRDRIANQFGGALDEYFNGWPGIGIVMAENDAASSRIVVATRQSLHPKRLQKLLQYGVFDYLVIDEAHHAFADNTYGTILKTLRSANPDLKVVGFTATPNRSDGKALGSIFTKIACSWLIPDGIATGYLTPVTRIKVTTRVNTTDVKNTAGDYAQKTLVSVLQTANWLDLAEQAFKQYIEPTERPTLAFFPSVEMSQEFVKRINSKAMPARHLDGTTSKEERRQILRDYTEGNVRLISNFGVLTEGFDAPQTSALLMARPTRAQSLYTQIIGRGLRPYPGKLECLLVELAVNDTKALEVGSLIGNMTFCPKCAVEHYAGLKKCPACGHEVTRTQRVKAGMAPTGELAVGGRLIANIEPLFEKSFAAWYTGNDGFFSCTLSFEDGAIVIIPPLEDNYFRLARIPADRQAPVQCLLRNEDLASLMLDADVIVHRDGKASAQKDAGWREYPASMAQLSALGKMKIDVPKGISKGMASQMLTHAIAVRRILED